MNRDLEQVKSYLSQNKIDDIERRLRNFKDKLKIFDGITSISEARKIAKENFCIKNDVNYIKLDNSMCVIVQSSDVFKVCLENDKEFFCYSIVKKESEGLKDESN